MDKAGKKRRREAEKAAAAADAPAKSKCVGRVPRVSPRRAPPPHAPRRAARRRRYTRVTGDAAVEEDALLDSDVELVLIQLPASVRPATTAPQAARECARSLSRSSSPRARPPRAPLP